ncbi:hypothetical protein BKA70DRAFT_12959 [Coprinopsis sp. MPI-PUGE-AT-0042]|nr:hypothetical protein BKA70DRAFT_12959 [Coprinopsis sp. MPI-PUGE-AT-0042]
MATPTLKILKSARTGQRTRLHSRQIGTNAPGTSGAPSSKLKPRHSHDVHMALGFHPDERTLLNAVFADDDDEEDTGSHHYSNEDQEAYAEEASDDEDHKLNWNEEQSILAWLMEDGPQQSVEDRLDTLVESLNEPFAAKHKQINKNLADSYIPAVREITRIHRVIDTSIDHTLGKGITIFNSACKDLEAATLAEYDELTEAYEQTRDTIGKLMDQLKAEYALRDKLWVDLEQKLDEIVDPVLVDLQDLPGEVERTITKLEKGYDKMHDQGKDKSTFTEQKLKDLLSKIGDPSLLM